MTKVEFRIGPRPDDFLGNSILKSKRKCPVCGGHHWYACEFRPDGSINFNQWKGVFSPTVSIIDSPNHGYLNDEADICLDCLTVLTGKRNHY